MEIILTVVICIWLMYKAGMITGEGWLTEMGKRPFHAPGPVPESRRYPNGSDLVKRTHDLKNQGLKKEGMQELVAQYNMQFIRQPITKKIQGVYCKAFSPILDLDELYEYGFCLPVYFTWHRRFGMIRYEFYCPEDWFNEVGPQMSRSETEELAEKYNMIFMRNPITNKSTGVYCVSKEPIPELDEILKNGEFSPVRFKRKKGFGRIRYKLYCPDEWMGEYGWRH